MEAFSSARTALLAAIDRYLGNQAVVSGVDAGLHVLLWLPQVSQRAVTDLLKHAEKLGVRVYSVAPFYLTPPPHAGLLLGYSSLSEKDIDEGIRRLATALKGDGGIRST